MIQNEAQLRQALEQIQSLYAVLDSLRVEVFTRNPRNFVILAEGPLEQIRQLQLQVDAHVHFLEQTPA